MFFLAILGLLMLYPVCVLFGMDHISDPDEHFWCMAVGIFFWLFFGVVAIHGWVSGKNDR